MGDRETRLGTVGVGLGAEGLDATGRLEQVGCHTWRTRNDLTGPTSRNRSRPCRICSDALPRRTTQIHNSLLQNVE